MSRHIAPMRVTISAPKHLDQTQENYIMLTNYIEQLVDTVQTYRNTIDRVDVAIMHLAQYLEADKFHCGSDLDNYVNIDDVRRYLIIIKDELHS